MRFSLAAFLGAFLLFQVQLIAGKSLLPWFGGAPMVWTTCMLFFQAVLLLGYAATHAAVARLGIRAQAAAHLGLVVAAAALLAIALGAGSSPMAPPESWRDGLAGNPVWRILLLLAVHLGLPAFVLATTSPLLQAWLARRSAERRGSPYSLYAVSNLGSLLGLLTYPFIVEPALDLDSQAVVWSIAFVAFAIAIASCGLAAKRAALPAVEPAVGGGSRPPRPRRGLGLLWVLLSAASSALLLATTNQLCQEVAAVPLLWVVPLVIYLATFIVCFRGEASYSRSLWAVLLILASVAACVSLSMGPTLGLRWEIGAHSFALLSACMVCHGELFRSRPHPEHLTSFYGAIALGGALGGAFVAIAAPACFEGFWEYPLALWGTGLLAVVAAWMDPASWMYRTKPSFPFTTLAALLTALLAVQMALRFGSGKPVPAAAMAASALSAALAAGIALRKRRASAAFARRGSMLGFAAAVLLALGMVMWAIEERAAGGAIYRSRSFLGSLVVLEKDRGDPARRALELRNGRVIHGRQFVEPSKRRLATTYYGPDSGVGLAILHHPRRARPDETLRIGAIGLGVGTVATYARGGDEVRFYEIDEKVARLASGPAALFTYLQDCEGRVAIETGDARLTLQREIREGRPGGFDILAIDAFSGDAIPVHLLTREALQVYLAHLRGPQGVIAFHISNGFLDLAPVVRGLAESAGLRGAIVESGSEAELCTPATWVLVTASGEAIEAPEILARSRPLESAGGPCLWTDRTSPIVGLLKR